MIDNYILGLLATDGCLQIYISKEGEKSYYISLEMKDQQIIEELGLIFNKKTRYRKRIILNKEREFYAISFNDKNYGLLLENKRQLIYYFRSLPEKEQWRFIRGCFDGDGGICKKTKSSGYRVYFCANSKDGLDKVYEEFFNKENIRFSKYYDKRGAGAYNYNVGDQSQVRKFLDIIYTNSDIKLQRKYEFYEQMVSIS